MTNKMKIALIGCGRIAFKHVEALAQLSEFFDLTAVCDVIVSRAQQKAKHYVALCPTLAEPMVYEDYVKLIEAGDFQIGVVATESGNHYAHVMALLEAGKHVIVEKPIALSTKHAEEMAALAKAKGLLLSVSHQNRFNPPIQALRQAVEAKRFGKLINGTARILWNRDQNYYSQAPWRGTAMWDGGTLMNQCIHNIDLLLWMMDSPVVSVYAQTGTYLRDIEMEDFGAIMLRFESGAIGLIEGSACVYPKNLEETLSIFGEKGTVVIGGLAVNEMKTWQFETEMPHDAAVFGINDAISDVYGNGHSKLYHNFYKALTAGEPLLIDGESGSMAMKVILAAYQSQKESRPISMADFEYSTQDFIAKK